MEHEVMKHGNGYAVKNKKTGKVSSKYPTRRQAMAGMSRMEEAMKHSDKLGAGARKREHLGAKEKVAVVMKEFKRGTLHSGSGAIVKNRKQAIAIAMSESGQSRKR